MRNVYLDINPISQSLLDEMETNRSTEGDFTAEQRNLARCGGGIGIDLSHLESLSKETKSLILNKLGCHETTKRDKT